MSIFSVLSNHMDWLSQRYSVAARNTANSDTPGYKAQQLSAFNDVLQAQSLSLTTTQVGHLAPTPSDQPSYAISPQHNSDMKTSGNDVAIDKEMQEIGDTSRQFAADINLEKVFQRMFLSSLKG